MKFVLIDRITELESGRRIVAEKALSLSEEYLADHFPAFPVLPGVFMLEAMVQAAAWVVREKLDFATPVVLLKAARNVTYKSFLAPGNILRVEANCQTLEPTESQFTASGTVGGREVVKGRLTLRHLSLSALGADWEASEARLRARQRELFRLLWRANPGAVAAGV